MGGGTSVGFHLQYDLEKIQQVEARPIYENILLGTPTFNLTTKDPQMVNLSRLSKDNIVTAHTATKSLSGVWSDHGINDFVLYAGNDSITFKSDSNGKIYPSASTLSGTCYFDKIIALP